MKCDSCGGSNLIEGTVKDSDGDRVDVFLPQDVSYLKIMLGVGGKAVNSYACVNCGNLQFKVYFDENEKTRYLKSE